MVLSRTVLSVAAAAAARRGATAARAGAPLAAGAAAVQTASPAVQTASLAASAPPAPPAPVGLTRGGAPPIPLGDERGKPHLTSARGMALLLDPTTNRGTAFSASERERLGLRGLVPPATQPLANQVERIMVAYGRIVGDLDRHAFLSNLHDRNIVLFYHVLSRHFEALAPVVYTPTVGDACRKFHSMFRRARGMYFSSQDVGEMGSMVWNWPREVDVVVVTDGSRVLGLGDLGANGMGIPVGKGCLYTAAGGIDPLRLLPVVIDVGTDNAALREDPLYLGLRQPRLTGRAYFAVVDEWVAAIRSRWPNALIQFEDFATTVAAPLLEAYRHPPHGPAFNDDIQSTGCVAVATVLSALTSRGLPAAALPAERIVCVGAGSAGLGVCDALAAAMALDGGAGGFPTADAAAASQFWVLDEHGLLSTAPPVGGTVGHDGAPLPPCSRANMAPGQARYARGDLPRGASLADVIRAVKPTVLLGLSGAGPGTFTEEALRAMAATTERPLVLPLSNPTSASECSAAEAFAWTDGRALFASGSPYDDVPLRGGGVGVCSQCNNVLNFPGVGLAVVALGASTVSESMFHAAAVALSQMVDPAERAAGRLLPRLGGLRDVSMRVAMAVGEVALAEGVAGVTEFGEGGLEGHLRDAMWTPQYSRLVPV